MIKLSVFGMITEISKEKGVIYINGKDSGASMCVNIENGSEELYNELEMLMRANSIINIKAIYVDAENVIFESYKKAE